MSVHASRAALVSILLGASGIPSVSAQDFVRGDANGDGLITAADGHFIHMYLFRGGHEPACLKAADADDSGHVDHADGVFVFHFAVFGTEAMPAPGPAVGPDPTDDELTCLAYGGGSPTSDPDSKMEIVDATAVVGGSATISLRATYSDFLGGYSGTIIDEAGVLADSANDLAVDPTPLTIENLGPIDRNNQPPFLAARLHDGKLRFGCNVAIGNSSFLPGSDVSLVSITIPLRSDTVPGQYELTLDAAELIHLDDGSIQPTVASGVLEVLPTRSFRRGDCNDDGAVDISDAIFTLGSLFLDDGIPSCDDACDSNDDGAVDISDAIATLGVLFLGDGVIPLPGMNDCGVDLTDDPIGCDAVERCP